MQPHSSDRQPVGIGLVAGTLAAGLVVVIFSEAIAARRPPSAPVPLPSFVDELSSYDTGRWMKADRWTNGSPFDNAWRADHVTHDAAASRMTITLDNRAYLGEPYSSGEYRTKGFYGYGCYEARFKPINEPGVVTSFFTFAGPYDNGGNGRHNEIDIEFVGKDTNRIQFNFWTNDDTYSSHNEYSVRYDTDFSQQAHNFGFRWTESGIEWYVDGNLVYVVDSKVVKTPKASESLHKIMMNVWPVDATAADWAGVFTYPGTPLKAQYEWVRYDSATQCSFTSPAQAAQLTYTSP
jgi:beta-glucanase (GH16 family)